MAYRCHNDRFSKNRIPPVNVDGGDIASWWHADGVALTEQKATDGKSHSSRTARVPLLPLWQREEGEGAAHFNQMLKPKALLSGE